MIELANKLYQEYRIRCFWHSPSNLIITEELIPFVINGLKKYGGRKGFILGGELKKLYEDRVA